MGRGRKGKYEEWRVKRIYQAIRRTGMDQAGIEAGDISSSTFYKWQKDKPEFSEGIGRAKRDFADINDDEIALTFRERLITAMQGAEEEWKTQEVTVLPNGETVKKVSTKTVKRPPAEWAFKIAAPQVGGNFGLDRQDVTSAGQRVRALTWYQPDEGDDNE